jgi:hypothetical protein
MAVNPLFEFRWPVHEAGYEWGGPEPGNYQPEDANWYARLVPVEPNGRVRRYAPLRKHGALFRTFADIEIGLHGEGIARFANEYGLLGRPPAGYRLGVPGPHVSDDFLDSWDIYWFWREAIRSMRNLLLLWDLLRGDRKRLASHIRWERYGRRGDTRVVYDPCPELPPGVPFGARGERAVGVIASREIRPDWLDYFTPEDVATPALTHLLCSVNAWAHGLIDPRLQFDERQERLVSRLVPGSLFGALWLQFHLAIVGQKDYRQCAVCHAWFEIGPKVNRDTKLYCGDACRSQALRNRRKRAQQLHDEGNAPEQIAEELGSDVPTVRKWISNKKE